MVLHLPCVEQTLGTHNDCFAVCTGDSFDIESVSSATSHGSFMSVVRAAKLAADQVSTFCSHGILP